MYMYNYYNVYNVLQSDTHTTSIWTYMYMCMYMYIHVYTCIKEQTIVADLEGQ